MVFIDGKYKKYMQFQSSSLTPTLATDKVFYIKTKYWYSLHDQFKSLNAQTKIYQKSIFPQTRTEAFGIHSPKVKYSILFDETDLPLFSHLDDVHFIIIKKKKSI